MWRGGYDRPATGIGAEASDSTPCPSCYDARLRVAELLLKCDDLGPRIGLLLHGSGSLNTINESVAGLGLLPKGDFARVPHFCSAIQTTQEESTK
jgi:hypothetical protein